MNRYDFRKNNNKNKNNNTDNNSKENCTTDELFALLDDPEHIPTLKDIFKIIKETHQTVTFMADKFDDINTRMNEIEQQNKQILKENQQLKNRLIKLEIADHRNQQQKLCTQLTIHGIPKKPNENLQNIITNVTKTLNINITQQNIKNIRRMNINNNTPIIVVELDTIELKQEIHTNFKQNGPIMLTQILNTSSNETTKIYINEYLTENTKNLLRETKKMREKFKIQFVWVKDGSVFARESSNSKIIKITHTDEIQHIFQNTQPQPTL